MIWSPESNSHCISADAMNHSSSIVTATRTQIGPVGKRSKVTLGSPFEKQM